jgi:hypothetical protein
MQMEQANPLRLAGIYNGVSGSLVGQVPYGYVTSVLLRGEYYHLLHHFTCKLSLYPVCVNDSPSHSHYNLLYVP